MIDFPRTLTENEVLYLAGVPSDKVCEGYVKFIDAMEIGVDFSDSNRNDIWLDRCNFVINNKLALFRTASESSTQTSFFLNEEQLDLIGDEKEVDFFLRDYGGEKPCVVAKNGFMTIAVFMPFTFPNYESDTDYNRTLADNALMAYKIITQEGK